MSDMTRDEEIIQEVDFRLSGSFGNCFEGYEEGFIDGAKWADENPTPCSVRMVGNQSYLKRQLREMGFAFDLNGNVLSPNHLAEKAAHYVIEKACKWLEEKNRMCMYELEMILGGNFIEDFKKAMEEQP